MFLSNRNPDRSVIQRRQLHLTSRPSMTGKEGPRSVSVRVFLGWVHVKREPVFVSKVDASVTRSQGYQNTVPRFEPLLVLGAELEDPQSNRVYVAYKCLGYPR